MLIFVQLVVFAVEDAISEHPLVPRDIPELLDEEGGPSESSTF